VPSKSLAKSRASCTDANLAEVGLSFGIRDSADCRAYGAVILGFSLSTDPAGDCSKAIAADSVENPLSYAGRFRAVPFVGGVCATEWKIDEKLDATTFQKSPWASSPKGLSAI
jgi:hypothetical protein